MTYTKFQSPWSALHELSGDAFNHIEGQWAAAKIDIDAHNHDTRYYTKTLADATFFRPAFYTGFDADKLDGQHMADLIAASLPTGAIMVWSGTSATIPTGWHICDGGTYGGKASPDLRDRFVIGAGGSYAVGATGGPATYNGTIAPTGTVTIGNHTLTVEELPAHTHSFSEQYNKFENTYYDWGRGQLSSRATTILHQDEGGDGSHGHTGSTIAITGVDPRPVYYSLYYIMKYA